MRSRLVFLPLALILSVSSAARAQAWDAPSFLSPRPGNDIGLYIFDPSRGDWGISGIWRQTGDLGLGVRLGIVDTKRSTRVLFGAEFFQTLLDSDAGATFDLAWTLGAGATLNDGTFLRIPAGLSIGRAVELGTVGLLPYLHPRIALDVFSLGGDTDTELGLTVDLGADVALGTDWMLRIGASLGDHDAFGVGIAYILGRRVVVR